MKRVSVIIPNYNYAKYLKERIESVLNQTYKVYEIIILDDASSDNSVNVIEEEIKKIKDIKVKFIKNIKNSNSVFSQWQKGLKEVTGDYFWIAEADDSCDKDFLKEAIKYFEKNKNIILFYSDSKKIDENGNVFSDSLKDYMDIFNTHKWDKSYINNGKNEIVENLSNNNTILNVSSVVWKTKALYYDIFENAKKFKVAGDWYIYSKVLEYGNIAFSNRSLNKFRKHKNSTSTIVNSNLEYKEVYEIQEEIRKKYNLSEEIVNRQKMRRRLMGFCENDNNIGEKKAAIIFDKYNKKQINRILKLSNYFIHKNYKCDIYFKSSCNKTPKEIYSEINQKNTSYSDIFTDYVLNKDYDIIVSTSLKNKKFVDDTDIDKKIYLKYALFDNKKLNKFLGGKNE